jgi:hypothetical protein
MMCLKRDLKSNMLKWAVLLVNTKEFFVHVDALFYASTCNNSSISVTVQEIATFKKHKFKIPWV